MEILSHLLGTCGEFHPNLITITIGVAFTILLFKKFNFSKKQ
jgi:hypothetical protein